MSKLLPPVPQPTKLDLLKDPIQEVRQYNKGHQMKIIKSIAAADSDDRAFESMQYSVDRIERFSKDIEKGISKRDTSMIHNNAVNIRSLCEAILSELKKVKS